MTVTIYSRSAHLHWDWLLWLEGTEREGHERGDVFVSERCDVSARQPQTAALKERPRRQIAQRNNMRVQQNSKVENRLGKWISRPVKNRVTMIIIINIGFSIKKFYFIKQE